MKTSGWTWAAVAALTLHAGCSDFEPRQEVIDLRVLAVAAEPPEVLLPVALNFDLGAPIDDAAATVARDGLYRFTEAPPPITLRALVADPRDPTRPVTFRATACLASGFVGCGDQSGAAGQGDERGAERTTEALVVQVAPDTQAALDDVQVTFAPTLEQLSRWLAEDPYKGFGSLYVQVDLVVIAADGTADRAAKIVAFTPPLLTLGGDQPPPAARVANRNPQLTGLRFDDEVRTLDQGLPVLVGGRTVGVHPVFDPADALEVYALQNFPSGDPPTLGYTAMTEKLTFDFFAVSGRFERASSTTRTPAGEVQDFGSKYTPPEGQPPEDTLYVVVRDERGGASWTTWKTSSTAP